MPNLIGKLMAGFKELFTSRLNLAKGTRFTSLVFIALALLVATGALFAANTYYDLDTDEVITEEVRRATELTRATGGLIAGGGDTDTLDSGVQLQVSGGDLKVGSDAFTVDESTGNTDIDGNLGVTGTSSMAATTTFGDSAVWDVDGTDVIGFDAPANASGTQVYTLPGESPSDDYVLQTNNSGELEWVDPESTVSGDITAVGDVTSGDAFTEGGSGSSLWFEGPNDEHEIELTPGSTDLTTDSTVYLPPDLNGTIALQNTASLEPGGVPFANDSGQLAQDYQNFYWDSGDSRLGIGTDSPSHALDVSGTTQANTLRMAGATDGYVGLEATSSGAGVTYSLPGDSNTSGQVLSTDSDGNLNWIDVSEGEGGLGGDGSDNHLAKWDGGELTDSPIETTLTSGDGDKLTIGDSTSTFSGNLEVDDSLTVTNTISGATATLADIVQSPEFSNPDGDTTVGSGSDGDIVLEPDSGRVVMGNDDYIETDDGYAIATSGKEILREMVPVFGSDVPVQCNTACDEEHAKITDDMSADFPDAYDGTTRKYKFVIKYADATTTGDSSWNLNDSDDDNIDSFDVASTDSTDIESSETYTTDSLPSSFDPTTDWYLEATTDSTADSGYDLRIFEVYLAAYDQID